MCEMRVYAAGNDFSVDLLELVDTIRKGQDFSRTNKGTKLKKTNKLTNIELLCKIVFNLQIQWIEEKDDIFAKVVRQRYLREFSIHHCCSFKLGRRSGNYIETNMFS